jgi:retinoid hydroxylase
MSHASSQPSSVLPPGRAGLPLLGESLTYLRNPEGFIAERQQRYGNVFTTHLFGRPTVVLIGAEAARFLFAHDGRNLEMTNTPNFETLLGPKSIGVQVGAAHQNLRRYLIQAFQPRALAQYAIAIEATTERYLQKWVAKREIVWYEELKRYTLDIACHLFLGIAIDDNDPLEKIYETWSKGLLTIPIRFPGSRYDQAVRAREELFCRFDLLIDQHQQNSSAQQNVLSLLLAAKDEENKPLSREEIKDNILAMLIAGHETLTSALTSLCLLLAQHPQVLAALRVEQAQLGFPTQITLASLKQMTYLEQVLKEVLRVAPPVVRSGSRRVIKTCEFGEYIIAQGWDIYYQIPETHQDSCIYTDPRRFDPDRFSPERSEDKQKVFSHIPFGGGIRECLGKEFAQLEMRLFAALLVRDYVWELAPEQNLERAVLPFSRPRDGLKVTFMRRHLSK